MTNAKELREADLFDPVRKFLEELGYDVKGEVAGCDITALKDGELLIVELKKGLTVNLLAQATDRQRFGDLVYMAVPKPKNFRQDSSFKKILHMVRRLELGLLFVSFAGKTPRVEVVLDPQPFHRERSAAGSRKKKEKVLGEHQKRKNSLNVGGVNRKKVLTAYREKAIEAALYLRENGVSKASCVKDGIQCEKAATILRDNHYGWFQRIRIGHYDLTEEGRKGLEEYREYIEHIRQDGSNEPEK